MGLREQAERDLGLIIEDKAFGFGWDIVLVSPEGISAVVTGLSNDISLAIDPDTGELVSGRTATVALRISTLRARGFSDNPKGIADSKSKPWVVAFRDINGVPCLFKVMKSNPDRAIGVITLILETYRQAIFYEGTWMFDGAIEYNGVMPLL